jgi:hypothetical protein
VYHSAQVAAWKKDVYISCMDKNTKPRAQPKKKRGPAKRLSPMVDTHLHMPADLLEWAKQTPEGFAPLVRRLLRQERERQQG